MLRVKTTTPKVLWRLNCVLGEGVLWVKEQNCIYFVDIMKKKIFILNIKNKKKKIIRIKKKIGFISHIKKNIFILGLKGELRIQDLKSKKIIRSISIEKQMKSNRINDGKTDPYGNLWFGTMNDTKKKVENGSLYCLDKKLNLIKVDQNYITPNGPAFIDKYNFYSTDSSKKVIYKIKINKKKKIILKKIFKKFSLKNGSPDGMTVDKNKNLWVAHYRAACITVLNAKGKKIHKVLFPAKNITNCIFGGINQNEVFITSALKGVSIKDKTKYNFSGSLFSVKTNIKGISPKSFNINL